MNKLKQKTIRFDKINSSNDFLFQICNRLKMKGWQFDNLTIEEKILKWSNRNPDKELIIKMSVVLIIENIKEVISRKKNVINSKIPKDYELGNPHNRWIHNEPIFRTQEQINRNNKKIEIETDKEYKKIKTILNSIKKKCSVKIIEK